MLRISDKSSPGPLSPLIIFLIAALIGFLAWPFLAPGPFAKLTANSEYRTWQILNVLQMLLLIFGAAYAIGVWRRISIGRTFSWPAFAAMILFVFLTALPYIAWDLFGSGKYDITQSIVLPRFNLLAVLGILGSSILGAGIFRIHVLSTEWLSARFNPQEEANAYREVSKFLERHLMFLGGILACAVITTTATREAIYAIEEIYPFSAEKPWQLAVYWSALLAVIYVSSRNSLLRIGHRIRDDFVSQHEPDQSPKEQLERKQELGEFLGLNRTHLAELKSVFSVLAPIAGAIGSQLI